jgi:3-oxoacyl-[acyl-carrier protein] reductase
MLDGKVALVTGASRGIGKAIALVLARHGARVAVNYFTHREEAENVAEEIQEIGSVPLIVGADVGDPGQVTEMVKKIIEHFGQMDILVNNAGAIVRPSSWQEISDEVWDRTLAVNLMGAFYTIRLAADHLLTSSDASIVNIASTFGPLIGSPGVIAYAAAKTGILSLTSTFAKALAPSVRVNCVAPGIIDTAMTAGSPESFVQQQIEKTPLKRLGTPEDVANTVYYLVSPLSRFVTGQIIIVDGGHSLR